MAYRVDPYQQFAVKTTIGNETHLEGTLSFEESLMLNGSLKGNIDAQGLLVIGPEAQVEGNITCDRVVIGGKVRGNVVARESLTFFETGQLFGDVRTAKLRVADGVLFEGQCEMIR